jgi:catechol-2,3-dioxygenase
MITVKYLITRCNIGHILTLQEKNFNRPVNHVAISVPDAQAASKWYVEVLGLTLLRPLVTMDRGKNLDGNIFRSTRRV